jgi:UDP-glucuronate decarboxylase
MRVENPEHDVYNIGKENERTIKELAREVLDATDTNSDITYEPLPEDDPSQRRPDISRAKTELNWEPETHLREGLEKTISYFEQNLHEK